MSENTFIAALHDPDIYPHVVEAVSCIETHISWVLLTGAHAYKIKKPIKLSFLDYSTLAKRKYYCEEELRLNKQSAPHLYLDVMPIYGSREQPSFKAQGKPIEYAVRMKQFDHQQGLDVLLERQGLDDGHIDRMAIAVAELHAGAKRIEEDPYGTAEAIGHPVEECLKALPDHDNDDQQAVERLREWCGQTAAALTDFFATRRKGGFIRECHGDLHLRNLVYIDDQVIAFDRIEFDPFLYNIDVMNDVAFLFMDILAYGRPHCAYRLLNKWLENNGDYTGVQCLRYYTVYRAMVLAKVTVLRLEQLEEERERQEARQVYRKYRDLALQWTKPQHPALVITCGVSGSGKSFIAERLMCDGRMLRIRSDCERKRLFAGETKEGLHQGLYAPEITQQVYQVLADYSRLLLEAGHAVVVDAAFLDRHQRIHLRHVAEECAVPFLIVHSHAPRPVLESRIASRSERNDDPSDADKNVLQAQLKSASLPGEDEQAFTLCIDTDDAGALDQLVEQVRLRLAVS